MKKIAFVFPGQGSQYVGMGESLCAEYKLAREIFDRASTVCGYNMLDFCGEGTYRDLINSPKALSALLTTTFAVYQVLRMETQVVPQFFAGYSFGELSALFCAKAISFEDALRIAIHKGILIDEVQENGSYAMTAIDGISSVEIVKICRKLNSPNNYLNVAVYNSEKNTVVSGCLASVEKIEGILREKRAKLNRLVIEAPFHSPYFDKVTGKSKWEIAKYQISQPMIPVISSLSAEILDSKEEIIKSLASHLVEPVRWADTINYLSARVEKIVEVGPKRILSSKIKNLEVCAFSSPKDLPVIKEQFSFSGDEIINIVNRCMAEAMSVRNLNNNNLVYEEKVIKPYRDIKQRVTNLSGTNVEPAMSDITAAFLMLKSVLRGKLVEVGEAESIIKSLYNEEKKLQYFKELDNVWKIKK